MGRKRSRFEPSEALQRLVLELAGVDPGEAAADTWDLAEYSGPADLCAEAVRLKRLADAADGATKYHFYVRSCLRYLEYVCAGNEEGTSDLEAQSKTLGSTAALLEYVAKKASSLVRSAVSRKDEAVLNDYAHLAFLALRLAAVARMQLFYNRSDRLRRFWDACKSFDRKKAKAARVQQSGPHAPGFHIGEDERQRDAEHRSHVVATGEDALLAVEHWRESEKLVSKVKETFGAGRATRMDKLPLIDLLSSHYKLSELARRVRRALEQIYVT